ncbi:beta-ketoacyl synthase N-terminal-like domain-containing protein, partial [Duganella callida]
MSKRIVVTGMGIVSPLGSGSETVWQRLLAGQSGVVRLDEQHTLDIPCKIGGVVAGFDAALAAEPKDQKKMDRFALFALAAAQEALDQAGWHPDSEDAQRRTATVVASGIGGFGAVVEAVRTTDGRGPRRLSPFTVPGFLANMAASQISIKHGLRGPLGAPITACAAGAQAIGDAARLI